ASAAESTTVEPSARASNRTACDEAATYRTTTRKTSSLKTTPRKAASVRPSVISVSPAVIPGPGADKDAAREPARAIVAIGCASIRSVRVIAVSANRWASHDTDAADSDSDSDLRLRVRERHGQ